MRVLVDTCVLSEVRHPRGNAAVRAAFDAIPDAHMFVSVITVGEIFKGIELLSAGEKKRELTEWLTGLCDRFGDRILPIDRETALAWGEITARARVKGIQIPISDGLIAATALRHGLHAMTRNTDHFAASGALIIDPWPPSGGA
jgi:predicted nucleic acid-binding protein